MFNILKNIFGFIYIILFIAIGVILLIPITIIVVISDFINGDLRL